MQKNFINQREPLAGLHVFRLVAQLGSFRLAADQLEVSPSAVSQTLRALETRLQTRLLQRTSRRVNLTEAGARFLDEVAPALDRIGAAAQQLHAEQGAPSGLLRINCPDLAADMLLIPRMPAFMARYPQIQVEIYTDNSLSGLVKGGFDAGLRFADVLERDVVAVPVLAGVQWGLFASPDYLARRGEPRHPKDLLAHDCIRFRFPGSGRLFEWPLQRGREALDVSLPARLIFTDQRLMVRAALLGLGVTFQLVSQMAPHVQAGDLREVLPDWRTPAQNMHLYYTSRRHLPPKLRALIDFLREDA